MYIPDYILLREYTTPIVAKVLDVPLRKVISMLERGYLHASIQEADGHGSKRLFSFDDVVRAFIIHRLESFGLSVVRLRFVSNILADPDQLALPFLLFKDHKSWCPVGDTREATEAHIMGYLQYPPDRDDPGPALWVPIDQMRDSVVWRISEMG